MRRNVLFVLAALCASAVFAAPAVAARDSVDGTVTVVSLASQGNPPIEGSNRLAGEYKGDLGTGGFLGTSTFGPPGEFSNKFRVFFKKGTIKGQLSGAGTVNPDGSLSFTGSGTLNGGSGRYKGAEGSFTFEGSQPADTTSNSEPAVFQVDGSVRY